MRGLPGDLQPEEPLTRLSLLHPVIPLGTLFDLYQPLQTILHLPPNLILHLSFPLALPILFRLVSIAYGIDNLITLSLWVLVGVDDESGTG